MRYTRTAITQLSKWYKKVLIKCAIFNAAVFVGAMGLSGNANAATSLVEAIADSDTGEYTLNGTETVTQELGYLAGDSRDFTINGNDNDIIASGEYISGIIVNRGRKLTIDNVGDISNPDSQGFSGFEGVLGSAINNSGTVDITDSVFSGNTADMDGGAINNESLSTVNITDSVFRENSATGGGAIRNGSGTANITNSVFSGNTAASIGGAIYNGAGEVNITDSVFSGNTANMDGGAIHNYDGTANITDSVFSGNTADYGGAIKNSRTGTVNIIADKKNVLFENNDADRGGAIYNESMRGMDGIVNLNAKDDHKITFSAATVDASNDIYNTSTLNLNEGRIEIYSAITDEATPLGTTNIGTESTMATVIANAITQKTLNIQSGSSLDINADGLKITQAVNNLGTITLGDGTLSSAISGTNGTTIINGDVTLANHLTNQNIEISNGSLIANSATDYIGNTNNLTIKNNGVLDLSSDDKSINTVAVNNFTVDSSASANSVIKFDVNFDDTNLSDKVSVAGTATGNLNLQSVNVQGDFDGGIDATKTITLFEGSNLSDLSIIEDSIRTATSQYSYDFEASDEAGKLVVTKAEGMTLPAAIGQEGADKNVTAYSLSEKYQADSDLGYLAGDGREFTIYGNGNDIIANGDNIGGIEVNSGQKLTIDNVGNVDEPDSQGFSGFEGDDGGAIYNGAGEVNITNSVFSKNTGDHGGGAIYNGAGEVNITNSVFSENKVDMSGGAISNSGTVNITDSVFSGNKNSHGIGGAIINWGTANIAKSFFSGNSAGSGGGAIMNDNGTVDITDTNFSENTSLHGFGGAIRNSSGTVKIADSVFSGNSARDGGAIFNEAGTVNIIADKKNVLFENNNAYQGGAIYNGYYYMVVGNPILNLNAKNGNKITFSAATDAASNDIYNVNILNLNEGRIEILSAITDEATPIGTTNIGTADTMATVIANAITQKALNIQSGSSLDINADGLKITDTISNLGTITLGNGTLSSAISGTNDANGTTVINGNVTLANNLTNQNIEISNGRLIANSTTDYIGNTNNLTIKNDGVLDLSSDDKSINHIAVNDFTVDSSMSPSSGIKFDVNFDGTKATNDTVSVAGTAVGPLNVQSVNVQGDLDGDIGTTTEITLFEGSNLSGLILVPNGIRTVTEQYAYDFMAGDNVGELIIKKANSMTLQEAIGQKGAEKNVTAYSLSEDYQADSALGILKGDNRDFTIYGNGNDIIASGVDGITVNSGQKLTIENVGDISNPDSQGFSGFEGGLGGAIFNFGTVNITDSVFSEISASMGGAIHNDEGTVNITDSVFSENYSQLCAGAIHNDDGEVNITDSVFRENSANEGGAIYNDAGEINITDSVFSKNSANAYGGAIYNSWAGTVNITDVNFSENTASYYGGAIMNWGTVNIFAENKDVLFENNDAAENGAISNRGELNLNAKDDHKITFSAATDTAINDIYNEGTLNLNEGRIEILSAITDATTPRGTTNIGTADTTATVIANAITQNALNINDGSSLAINAENLNITNTISNSGTITLGNGTLSSAISGTNGTTVINGNVTANSAILQAITINADKSLTASAANIGGAVTNSGTLALNGGTLAHAVTGTGSTVIDGDVTADSAISQAITINADKALTASADNIGGAVTNSGTVNLNSGTLTQTITGGAINILASQEVTSDLSKLAGTFENQGTLNLQGELSKDIAGDGTTVLQNDITLTDTRTIAGTLNLNGQTIDMGNDPAKYTELNVGNLTGNGSLQIDVDMTNNAGKATSNDKLYITSGTANNATINLTTINVQNELATSDSIYSNYVDYVTGNNSNITYQLSGSKDGQIVVVTTEQKYTFTKGSDGSLNVVAQEYTGGLSDYITGEVSANNFSINKDITFKDNENIGLTQGSDTTKNVFVNNGSTLTGFDGKDKHNNGITIADGYTLNLTGSENASMENFITALEVNNGGGLNVTDMNFSNNTTDIANNGTLTLAGTNSFASGIIGNGATNITSGTTTNNGTIEQNTVSIASGATLNTNASGLVASDGVNNAGNLNLTGGVNANTISGSGTTQISGSVENTGTISQAVNITSGSLSTSANGLGGAVTNTVDGGLILNGGTLTQAISGNGSTQINGDVISNALISQAIDIDSGSLTTSASNLGGAVTNTVDGGLILNGGTLTQAVSGNGSTIIDGDVLWGANAGLTNTTIAQNGSLDIGTNEVTLGNTSIDGTLKMTITNMAKDSSVYEGGKLIVNDLALGEESKLSMTVASGLITEENASTGGLDLIVANGETSGKFAEMLSNNRYTVTPDEDGKFKITYAASSSDVVNAGGGNANNAQAAEAWDKVPTTGNAATDDMQAHLNELSQHDSQAYVKALNNLAPTDSQAVSRTTVDVNNLINRQIERRQDIQGINSGDTFQNVGVWMEGLYNYSKQDSSSNNAGFTGRTAGFVLGADGKVNEKTTLGFGYAYNQTDADTLDRDIDVDGHTLFVYGKYQPEKWYVRGMAHYGFADYEEKADVAGRRNSADYDVQNFGLAAYVGYDLPNGFTPEGGLRFTHVSQDSYTDFAGQKINVEDNDILTLVAGAKYSKTFEGEDGIHWTPKARAALTYDIMSDDNNTNVNIAGINYDINGKRLDRFGVEAGVGLEADVNNWNFSIGYDAGIREDYISHTGMLKARYNF